MSASTSLRQNHFRFRSDTGTVDGTPTWYQGEDCDANIDVTGGNTKFRLRIAVQEVGGVTSASAAYELRCSLDTYGSIVITSDTSVRSADVSSDASSTNATVSRLTGTGLFVTGEYDEDGTTDAVSITANNWTEFEFGLEIVAADVTDGQLVDFRVYRAGSALNTYQVTPRVVISKSSDFGSVKAIKESPPKGTSVAASVITTTEKVAAATGDLIVVTAARRADDTFLSLTDSLGGAVGSGRTLAQSGRNGSASMRTYYQYASSAMEFTITYTWSASQTFNELQLTVFKGTFQSSPLDAAPATNTDSATPMICPATGTLSQADELIYAASHQAQGASDLVPTSPFVLIGIKSGISLTVASDVVAATTSVVPQFTGTGNIGINTTLSFMKQTVTADDLFAQAIM